MNNENTPLVTICIPNYNYGHYLKNCLDSVLNQTYTNLEVYFRDNNSSDDSYNIALSYRNKFKERGIYFSVSDNKRNLGSDINSKLATRDSEGEFIYTLASDDAIKSNFIERCINVFNTNPNVGLVMTHREEVDEYGNIKSIEPFYNENCIVDRESQAAVFMMAGIAIPGQRMTRRTILNCTTKYSRTFQVAGDWFDNFLYSCFGDVAYLKEPLCQYRVHTGNETNESERNLMGIFEHYQLINIFKDVSQSFGMEKPNKRYYEAIEKLGNMCLRYAMKMFRNNMNDVANRYLLLAPVFKRNIIEDITYNKLLICVSCQGKELTERLDEIESENVLKRNVSYNPPEGYTLIDENGRTILK